AGPHEQSRRGSKAPRRGWRRSPAGRSDHARDGAESRSGGSTARPYFDIVQIINVLEQTLIRGATAGQIAASVEAAIRESGFVPGEKLPPIRALAGELRVSPMTVASAYGELRRRGLLLAAGRRGTRVADRPPLQLRTRIFVPPGARDLATGNPDPELLPPLAEALTRIDTS